MPSLNRYPLFVPTLSPLVLVMVPPHYLLVVIRQRVIFRVTLTWKRVFPPATLWFLLFSHFPKSHPSLSRIIPRASIYSSVISTPYPPKFSLHFHILILSLHELLLFTATLAIQRLNPPISLHPLPIVPAHLPGLQAQEHISLKFVSGWLAFPITGPDCNFFLMGKLQHPPGLLHVGGFQGHRCRIFLGILRVVSRCDETEERSIKLYKRIVPDIIILCCLVLRAWKVMHQVHKTGF